MAIRNSESGKSGGKSIIVLGIVSAISAFLLAWVYIATSRRIERQKILAINSSLAEVLPLAQRFEKIETLPVWIGYDSANQKVGIVFSASPRGYGGPIGILCGVQRDGKVAGLRIATPGEGLKETPGLGLKIREDFFRQQFIGKEKEEIRIKREGGRIDAITAATISSKAVADGIREGIARYEEFLR